MELFEAAAARCMNWWNISLRESWIDFGISHTFILSKLLEKVFGMLFGVPFGVPLGVDGAILACILPSKPFESRLCPDTRISESEGDVVEGIELQLAR